MHAWSSEDRVERRATTASAVRDGFLSSMTRLPLTLRSIPTNFRSVLLQDDEQTSPVLWDLRVPTGSPEPGDFTPQVDVLWNTTAVVSQGLRRPVAILEPPSAQASLLPSSALSSAPSSAHAHVSYSADRLARAIVLGARCANDPRTLAAWGQQVGISRGALRVWCKAAGVSARSSLDFLRLLRAVLISRHQAWDLLAILDVVDERSLLRLLDRGKVRDIRRQGSMTVNEFTRRQQFVTNQDVLNAVARALNADPD